MIVVTVRSDSVSPFAVMPCRAFSLGRYVGYSSANYLMYFAATASDSIIGLARHRLCAGSCAGCNGSVSGFDCIAAGFQSIQPYSVTLNGDTLSKRTFILAATMTVATALAGQAPVDSDTLHSTREPGGDGLSGPDTSSSQRPSLRTKALAATSKARKSIQWKSLQRDSLGRKLLQAKPTGMVELGGLHGAVPFAWQGQSPWNAYAKGALGLDLLGAPLQVTFDLGTDLPIRGQRNRIRIAFDPGRAALMQRWSDAYDTRASSAKLDSLEQQKASAQRRVDGTAARLAALIAARARQIVADSVAKAQGNVLPPADSLPDASLPAVGQPAFNDSLRPELGKAPMPEVLAQQRIDSLSGLLDRQKRALAQTETALEKGKHAHEQKLAHSRFGADKKPLARRVAQGLRRFELGSCAPEGTGYLINGVNLQGASFTYAQKELYFSFDHGRILDDAALDANPSAGQLRMLHQSLFMADARDLNPRRITALRVGYGLPEGTHAHLGFLRGSRFDHPPGAGAPADERHKLLNHVVEVNLGLEVLKGHQLRLVYARSVVGPRNASGEGDEQGAAPSDLFSREQRPAEAIKLTWESDFRKSGTRVGLEGRSVSPWFQSYGVGFLRSGAKAGELRVDQSLGQRVRLRARGVLEERVVIGESSDRQLLIQRGQIAIQLKPARTMSLQISYTPVHAGWRDAHGPSTFNQAITGSLHIRERVRASVLSGQAAVSWLQWNSSDGGHGGALTPTAGAQLALGEQWSLSATWTALLPIGADTLTALNNIGVQAGWRSTKGWAVEAGVQFAQDDGPAWLAELRKGILKGMDIGARSQRFANYPQFQGGDAIEPATTDHTFTLFLRYQW